MTDKQRQAIRDSAHLLRSRLTYLLLCSHALKSDLADKLSNNQEPEFQQLDTVLEETKATLQILLKQLEPELAARSIKECAVEMIGLPAESVTGHGS
jgi:hypothetical protein